MQQTIEIPVYSQERELMLIAVNADVDGGYAVHKAISKTGYALTHLKSGISLGNRPSINELLARREYLKAATIGGVPVADMPACEICANALLIKQIVHDATPDDRLMEKVTYVADVLCKETEYDTGN